MGSIHRIHTTGLSCVLESLFQMMQSGEDKEKDVISNNSDEASMDTSLL